MISEAYLMATKRISEMMSAIQDAGVPPRFTNEFLKSLGFKSTNDRAFVGVLKGIGFLDDSGSPTEKYKSYKNKSEAKIVLGQALKERYEDLFLANEKAHDLSIDKLKGIFATKTGKGDSVVQQMAGTFKALASLAEFKDVELKNITKENNKDDNKILDKDIQSEKNNKAGAEFHYNIQIHLPVTKDISVYNAIFKSIKEHLL